MLTNQRLFLKTYKGKVNVLLKTIVKMIYHLKDTKMDYYQFRIICQYEIDSMIVSEKTKYRKTPVGVYVQYVLKREKKSFFLKINELAPVLKGEGRIDEYHVDSNGRVIMQVKSILSSVIGKSIPVLHERLVEFKWEHVDIDANFIHNLIIQYEWERVNGVAKIVQMGKEYFKKTA